MFCKLNIRRTFNTKKIAQAKKIQILNEHHWIPQLTLVWWISEWHCSWALEVNTCSSSVSGWRGEEKPGCAVTQMHHPISSTSPVPPDAQLFICYVAGIHYLSGIFSFITQINNAHFFFWKSWQNCKQSCCANCVMIFPNLAYDTFYDKVMSLSLQDKVSSHEYFTSIT